MARSSLVSFLVVLAAWAAPAAGQQVTLPLGDYEALRERARLKQVEPAPVAAAFALQSVDLEIELGAGSARIDHRLAVTVFSQDWQEVALGDAGSFVAAELGDLEGRLDISGEQVSLRLRGSGRHEVRLESVIATVADDSATRPTRRFELTTPPAAIIRGRLRAGRDEEVELRGDGAIGRTEDGDWWFVARGDSALTFELRGRRQTPRRALLPLRFDSISATLTEVGRTRIRSRGLVRARVIQGQLERLELEVPESVEVVDVSGPTAGWDLVEGRLQVTPLEPAEDLFEIVVEMTMPPAAELRSPALEPLGSLRSRQLTAVSVVGDGLLELLDAQALRLAAAGELADLPADWRSGRRFFARRDGAAAPRWRVEWADSTQVLAAQVDRLLVDVAVGESGQAAYQLWAEVRNRGVRHLMITPPAGFALIDARRDGATVVPGESGGALAVPLGVHNRWLHLSGTLPLRLLEKGQLHLELPVLSAPVARVELRAVLPGGRSYSLVDGTRSGSVGLPPSDVRDVGTVARENFIAGQMVSQNLEAGYRHELWPRPPGFRTLEAGWSALSEAPGPLVVEISQEKDGASWF